MTEAPHRLGIAELAAAYEGGGLTAAAVVDHLLGRIERLDGGLRAFIEVAPEDARRSAAASDRRIAEGRPRALEGVPIAVKANIDVCGLDTSAGMEAGRGRIATRDAEAVARLRAAGAVILGTLNMHEAALGADNDNPWFGRAFNPHGSGRTPGGSSGGSGAAVAAGLCTAALGTDTLGSVRIPAAYCGVYGLKPTAGAVSQDGLELVVAAFDMIGPITRSLDDLERLHRVLADAAAPAPVKRIALLKDLGGVRCEPAVLAAYERALTAVRAEGFATAESLELELKPIRLAGFVRASLELGERLAPLAARKPEGLSESLRFLLDYGRRVPADEVAAGDALLERARATVIAAVGDGALLLPTAPQAAFVQGSRAPANQADFTALASIAGLPAIALPAGVDANGMPVGVQLVGAAGNEIGLIDLARRLEPYLGGAVLPPDF